MAEIQKGLNLKGKILILKGHNDMTDADLQEMADKTKDKGGVGVLWLPEGMEADSATIEECIKKLQTIRKGLNAGKPRSKGGSTRN